MKEFTITNRDDLIDAFRSINKVLEDNSLLNREKKYNLVFKEYRKPKSSAQHRTYWKCISHLKKAFFDVGSIYNEDQLHNFVKMASGFTESVEGVVTPKSIADTSQDATSKELNFLIEWIVMFCADKLDYQIQIGDE